MRFRQPWSLSRLGWCHPLITARRRARWEWIFWWMPALCPRWQRQEVERSLLCCRLCSGREDRRQPDMKVDQSFDANTYQQIVQHGLLLHMDLDPQPGNNQLRLGVQDNRTGLVGSLGAPMPQ